MNEKILITDDDIDIRNMLQTKLHQDGYYVRSEENAAGFRKALEEEEFHCVLLDYNLPDGDGISLIKELIEVFPNLPVILITAHSSIERAVDTMRAGAYDFCPKPIDWNRLTVSVKNAIERTALTSRITQLESVRKNSLCKLVGGSAEMQVVYQIIETVASTNAPVLITGESGTGKELVAQAIHQLSDRNHREMIEVNCAAIPKDLLENELFGHEPSAFTGAKERHIGRCERANGSTLVS
jgi:DNA-binding NtrC family response regulator